jgi:hypothetical protein
VAATVSLLHSPQETQNLGGRIAALVSRLQAVQRGRSVGRHREGANVIGVLVMVRMGLLWITIPSRYVDYMV